MVAAVILHRHGAPLLLPRHTARHWTLDCHFQQKGGVKGCHTKPLQLVVEAIVGAGWSTFYLPSFYVGKKNRQIMLYLVRHFFISPVHTTVTISPLKAVLVEKNIAGGRRPLNSRGYSLFFGRPYFPAPTIKKGRSVITTHIQKSYFYHSTKKGLFYPVALTDKLYFVLHHQWHLYF
jgi:hypothetical protein